MAENSRCSHRQTLCLRDCLCLTHPLVATPWTFLAFAALSRYFKLTRYDEATPLYPALRREKHVRTYVRHRSRIPFTTDRPVPLLLHHAVMHVRPHDKIGGYGQVSL
jgi:hypothetical protein